MFQNKLLKNILLNALETIKTLAIVIIVAFVLKTYLIQTFVIDGQSMEPNFHQNEYLLVDKLSYRLAEPRRGDVIVFIPPEEPTKNYIKRIIGLPGDHVEIQGGEIFVNDIKINEPYIKDKLTISSVVAEYDIKLKSGSYFVLGDNRNNSKDSRSIGPIPEKNIIGRTFIVLFPFKNTRLVTHLDYKALASQ